METGASGRSTVERVLESHGTRGRELSIVARSSGTAETRVESCEEESETHLSRASRRPGLELKVLLGIPLVFMRACRRRVTIEVLLLLLLESQRVSCRARRNDRSSKSDTGSERCRERNAHERHCSSRRRPPGRARCARLPRARSDHGYRHSATARGQAARIRRPLRRLATTRATAESLGFLVGFF